MTQFFGAPWMVKDVDEDHRYVNATIGPAEKRLFLFNPNPYLEDDHKSEMREATYLVAAAPELFNALSALVNALTNPDAVFDLEELVEQGDAALRKANEWVGK